MFCRKTHKNKYFPRWNKNTYTERNLDKNCVLIWQKNKNSNIFIKTLKSGRLKLKNKRKKFTKKNTHTNFYKIFLKGIFYFKVAAIPSPQLWETPPWLLLVVLFSGIFFLACRSKPLLLLVVGGPLGNRTTPTGTPSLNFRPISGLLPGVDTGELPKLKV